MHLTMQESNFRDETKSKKVHTENPIEKYVGWTDTSSIFIFNISGVIPLFENHFSYLKILPRNKLKLTDVRPK